MPVGDDGGVVDFAFAGAMGTRFFVRARLRLSPTTDASPERRTMTDPQDPQVEGDPEDHYEGDPTPADPGLETEAPDSDAAEPAPAATEAIRPERQARKSASRGGSSIPAPKPLSPYAVIETGGKQYRVSVGDRIAVEHLPADAGGAITIDRVLLLGGDGATRVGTPTVTGAAVTARIDEHYRGEKIVVFKYKAKKGYRRRIGHRQSLTRLTITDIAG